MPDEEEQYRAYRHVVEAFGGKPVVIRTFDVGGDKLPVGGYPTDPNPFLGWRAIRMCLDEPELFKTQLRALLRAAMHGDVRIMFPLIITLDNVANDGVPGEADNVHSDVEDLTGGAGGDTSGDPNSDDRLSRLERPAANEYR